MRNVIFDLDGTLLNSKSGIIKSLDEMIKELSLPKITNYDRFIGPPIEQSVREYYRLDDIRIKEAAAVFRKAYTEKYLFDANLYDGIPKMLSVLIEMGFKLAIATNKREEYALTIIKHFNLDSYCEPCVGSIADLRTNKEHVIYECLRRMNVTSKQAIYVGDTEHDKVGSLAAGLEFIPVTWGFGYNFNDVGFSRPSQLIHCFGGITYD